MKYEFIFVKTLLVINIFKGKIFYCKLINNFQISFPCHKPNSIVPFSFAFPYIYPSYQITTLCPNCLMGFHLLEGFIFTVVSLIFFYLFSKKTIIIFIWYTHSYLFFLSLHFLIVLDHSLSLGVRELFLFAYWRHKQSFFFYCFIL